MKQLEITSHMLVKNGVLMAYGQLQTKVQLLMETKMEKLLVNQSQLHKLVIKQLMETLMEQQLNN